MRFRYIISVFFIIGFSFNYFAINVSLDSIPYESSCSVNYLGANFDVLRMDAPALLTDSLAYTTSLINALNNAISIQNNNIDLIAVIVAIIGILVTIMGMTLAIVGYFGFKDFKKETMEHMDSINGDIKEYKKFVSEDIKDYKKSVSDYIVEVKGDLQDRIEEIKRLSKDVNDKAKQVDALAKKQEFQNQYLKRINEYLFLITNSIVDSNGGGGEIESIIRNILYNQYYIVKVFLPWSDSPTDSTEAAFRYLQSNGTEENIKDLIIIAENDLDERKKRMAIETIGFIRAKFMIG